MTCFWGDNHVVAQQGQTQYEAFPHATAGTAPGGTYPWCAFGAPPIPTAVPGSPGATASVTIAALFAHLGAWWDRARGGGPCPNLPRAPPP